MVVQRSDLTIFPFIGPEHPFYPEVQRFRTMLGEHPSHGEMMKGAIQAEIKGRLLPDRRWELNRFYCSFQYWDDAGPLPFRALTLYYSVKTGRMDYYTFPEEPYLTRMAPFFNGKSSHQGKGKPASRIDVLRYVPLRRLTFRITAPDPTGPPLIGKFKRRSRFKIAYDRLVRVSRALSCSPSTFSVAAPMGMDERYRVYFQEARPGRVLATLLDPGNLQDLLHRLGSIHRDLHAFDLPDIPEWDFPAFVENLKMEIEWICFFYPDRVLFLHNVLDLLLKQTPCINPRDYTLCHGDFVPSQILADGGHWSVIDFDLIVRGDPYLEIAKLMASLKYDVPFFENCFMAQKEGWSGPLEEAWASYLEGYREKAQVALDWKRLLWYWICCEIGYLALMLKKDWFSPVAFERAIRLIGDLTERFRRERGGDF